MTFAITYIMVVLLFLGDTCAISACEYKNMYIMYPVISASVLHIGLFQLRKWPRPCFKLHSGYINGLN